MEISILGIAPPPGREEIGKLPCGLRREHPAAHLRVMVQPALREQIDHAAARARLGIGSAVDHAGDARVHDRARAHRAGLESDVEGTLAKAVVAERAPRVAACAVGSLDATGAL